MSDTERMREAICDDLYAALRDMAHYPLGKHRKALLAAINALSALAVPEQAPETPTDAERPYYRQWLALGSPWMPPAPAALPDGKDAERWRMLREMGAWVDVSDEDGWHCTLLKGDALDAAIDAAIQAQTEGEHAPLQVGEKHD